VLTAVAYGRVAGNGFIDYDDLAYVTENPHIRSGLTLDAVRWAFTTGYHSNWHPLTWISHAVDVSLFGLEPAGHHLVSLALHALSAILLFEALARMTGAAARSFVVAALFAVHPLHVESVAWAAERKDVLSTAFGMGCLLAYALGRRRVLLVALFALSLLSKPMLVTLPFVLLLLDVWPLARRERWSLLVREKLPLFAMSFVSAAITWIVQARGGAVAALELLPFPARLANAVVAYVTYLVATFVPKDLAVLYPFETPLPAWKVAGSFLVLAAITIAVIRARAKAPYLAVGWLWYVGTLVPVIGLVQVGLQSHADRYTYVPLVGIFVMVVWALAERLPRAASLTVAGAAIAVCVALTWRQVGLWRDSETLFEHTLAVTTQNHVIEGNLGGTFARAGRFEEAMRHLEAATRIRPDHAPSVSNMGVVLLRQGRVEEAIPLFRKSVALDAHHLDGWLNLANALAQTGDHDGAAAALRRAQELAPDDARIAELARAASSASPDDSFARANGLRDQRLYAEAETAYRETLEANPSHTGARNNLAILLAMRGDTAGAAQQFEELLRSDPNDATAHFNLGAMLAKQGRFDEAIARFEQALALQPDYAAAQRALEEARRKAAINP
jgi:tetratricopeptide (TPR) repeat protein